MKSDPPFLGQLHDGFCRCPGCKPAPAAQSGMTVGDVLFAVCALAICLVLASVMPGAR